MKSIFNRLHAKFLSLQNNEEGQDLVEYALLVALIALVCISGMGSVGTALSTAFTNIHTSLA